MFGGTEAVKIFPRLPSPDLCVSVWCGFHYERFAHAPLLPSKENGMGEAIDRVCDQCGYLLEKDRWLRNNAQSGIKIQVE